VLEFTEAVPPPASMSGRAILVELAKELGIEFADDVTREIQNIVAEKLDGALRAYCWNTGQARTALPKEAFTRAAIAASPGPIPHPLTQYEAYKHDIVSVGKHYKLK
jgi:hypothetical protein